MTHHHYPDEQTWQEWLIITPTKCDWCDAKPRWAAWHGLGAACDEHRHELKREAREGAAEARADQWRDQ